MTKYLLIESRDPYDSADSAAFLELAKGLRVHGNDVTLFLVQNGVLATRSGAELGAIYVNLARAGVEVLADSFALRERAIDDLAEGVQPAEVERLVGLMTEGGVKAMWH